MCRWLVLVLSCVFFFFFFNDTATTEIYTLSLHDALPISRPTCSARALDPSCRSRPSRRSEEHTSELQSPWHLVCRLLLEKKKNTKKKRTDVGAEKELEKAKGV